MLHSPGHWLIPLALGLAVSATAAQAAPPGGRPDPLDAKAAVPAAVYESALTGRRRGADAPPIAWREANDSAARVGGWRAYAREAQQPEAATPVATDPGPKSPPAGGRQTP